MKRFASLNLNRCLSSVFQSSDIEKERLLKITNDYVHEKIDADEAIGAFEAILEEETNTFVCEQLHECIRIIKED